MKNDYHILVVDDNPDNRLLLEAGLRPCGYRVTALGDGETSLHAIADRPDEFDLVLLDLKMPGLTGAEVLNRLREKHSRLDLPVIVVTALGANDHMVSALRAGANDYITKPFDFEPLAERIRTQLELVASRRALSAEVEERRRAQARFEEMADCLKAATNSAGIGLWEWLPASGEFIWDEPLCRLYGLDPATANPGREAWQRIVHPDDHDRFARKLDDALAGRGSFDTTFRIVTSKGEVRHLEGHASVQRSPNGTLTKATGANWDISERRHAREATLEAAERERNRIGRDLHDSICQELGGIGLLTAAMEERMRQLDCPEAQSASIISRELVRVTEQARALAQGLSPLSSEGNLSQALESLAARHRQAHPSLAIHLDLDQNCAKLSPAYSSELFLVASEALSNAVRHGNPQSISIELRNDGDELVLAVNDDGGGNAGQLIENKGLGLGSMRYRAWTLGGRIQFSDSSDQTGIRVECRFPTS